MGILSFFVVLGCGAVLAVWLGKKMAGWKRLLLWAGTSTFAIGAVTILAVVFLPRTTFGELGHGDGMGLIGLMLFGAIGMAAGLLLLLILTVIFIVGHRRRAKLSEE
jgi:hypothetical protein